MRIRDINCRVVIAAILSSAAISLLAPSEASAGCSLGARLDPTNHNCRFPGSSLPDGPRREVEDSGSETQTVPTSRNSVTSGAVLRNRWSGKCLQTMGQEKSNGSIVNIWDCTNTTNQAWVLTRKGELRNRWSGKCLQTMGQENLNGSTVNIWDCTNTSNQMWEPTSAGELRNRWSGKCLQTMGQEKENGSSVNIWDCTNTTNQMWRVSSR